MDVGQKKRDVHIDSDAPQRISDYGKFISAQIPNKHKDRELYDLVTK